MGPVIAVASLDPIAMDLSIEPTLMEVEVVEPAMAATGSGSVASGSAQVSSGVGGSGTQEEEVNPFQRRPRLVASPSLRETPKSRAGKSGIETGKEKGKGSGKDEVLVPRKSVAVVAREMRDLREQEGLPALRRASKILEMLSTFLVGRVNVHREVNDYVSELERALIDADKEWNIREESIKSQVVERVVTPPKAGGTTKRSRSKQRSPTTPRSKRVRETEPPVANVDEASEWKTVSHGKKKANGRMPAKPPEPKEKPKGIRPKSDALVIGVTDPQSYAAILKKIKGDPTLKELGSNVARIRRTRKGEMLFELRNDASVKSVAFKGVLEGALGSDAKVRALSQRVVVECRNIDEVTTETELREALFEQFSLGKEEEAVDIKLRRAYAGTQIATLKLPVVEAKVLLEKGKIRVGWTICPLKIPERQPLRCFKCYGFGHKAGSCTGADRSGRCFRCGDAGHLSKDCRGKPKCMLCQGSDSNHPTGSFRCKAYLEAKARGGWK
jgi:hypothetical protein